MELIINENRVIFGYESGLELINKEVKWINKLLTEYQTADPKEKYRMLDYLYEMHFSKEDFVKMINESYGFNFDTTVKLPTKMEFEHTIPEGHGHDFNGRTQRYRAVLEVATNKDNKFEDKAYSREEIIDLMHQGKIFPIRMKLDDILGYSEGKEPYQDIQTFIPDVIKFENVETER